MYSVPLPSFLLEQQGQAMIQFIACILLPVAILMCGYAVSGRCGYFSP